MAKASELVADLLAPMTPDATLESLMIALASFSRPTNRGPSSRHRSLLTMLAPELHVA